MRQWGDEKYPAMISTGDNSCIEVLPSPEENDVPLRGKFAHLALATDDTDGCAARVREAGYEITIEPKDVELSDITARIAFCTGPCGEKSSSSLTRSKPIYKIKSPKKQSLRSFPQALLPYWRVFSR